MAAESDEYAYARRLVTAYFAMLTVGCGADACGSAFCRSNPHASTPVATAVDAVVLSIRLATTTPMPLCVKLDRVDAEERPEVDDEEEDDDDDANTNTNPEHQQEQVCSPRRRLSHAVEMDSALNDPRTDESDADTARRWSLPKQKLLQAIHRQSERRATHWGR